jgi:hypothetical protein
VDRVVSLSAYRGKEQITAARAEVLENKYTLVEAFQARAFTGISASAFSSFATFWNPPVNKSARGFGALEASVNGINKIDLIDQNSIPGAVTLFYSPVLRPMPLEFFEHPVMQALAKSFCGLLDLIEDVSAPARWRINPYPARILLNDDCPRFATTPSIIVENVNFGVSLLVRRENILGGATLLYDFSNNLLVDATMTDPMDLIIINAKSARLATYSAERAVPSKDGVRDTLIMSFTRLPD